MDNFAAPPRPKTYTGDIANLPPALSALTKQTRWMLWRWELTKNKRGELKWTKVPYQPNGANAKSNDPKTWATHEDAVDAIERVEADGIGYALLNDELGLSAVDIDDCRDESTGAVEPWARESLDKAKECGAYIEITPSGTGFRIIGTSDKPAMHTDIVVPSDRAKAGIEIYRNVATGRYITVSGCEVGNSSNLVNIDPVVDRLIPTKPETRPNNETEQVSQPTNGIDRSADFHSEVWRLASQEMTVDEIARAMRSHPGADKYGHRLHAEILRSYGKWQEEHGAQQEPPKPFTFINLKEWSFDNVPQREWAVPDRIPLRQVNLFSGEGAIGKSTVQLHLCTAHVLGRDWLGTLPSQGPAFFIDAEDDDKELHRRLAAILDHYQATFEQAIDGGLWLRSLLGEDAVLASTTKGGIVRPTALYKALLERTGDLKPKMIGIASAADVFAGNEIVRPEVQQFIGLLSKLALAANGAVSLISHPSLTGISSDSGLSGSTQWHNSVRSRMWMKGVKAEPGEQQDDDLRELVFKKNNYGPKSNSIVLRYERGLFLPVPGMTSLDAAAHAAKVEEVFMALLRKLTDQGTDLSPAGQSHSYAPTVMVKHAEAKGMRKAELANAMQRALDAGAVRVVTLHPDTTRERKVLRAS